MFHLPISLPFFPPGLWSGLVLQLQGGAPPLQLPEGLEEAGGRHQTRLNPWAQRLLFGKIGWQILEQEDGMAGCSLFGMK